MRLGKLIKITPKILSIGLIGCGLTVGIGWWIKDSWFNSKMTYLTTPVVRQDLTEKVLASGTVHPIKTIEVGAQVSGQLKHLHVKLGDYVKSGQLLAEIDPALKQNSLKDAQIQVKKLQAQRRAKLVSIRQYSAAYQRQSKLAVRGAVSRANLESTQAQLESAQADLDALEAQLEQAAIEVNNAAVNLAYTKITAPIDGVVTSIITEEGQTVVSTQAATPILKLANLDTITVKAEISEADVMRVRPGQKVYFTTLGDPTTRYFSKLRAIEPSPTSEISSSSSTSSSTAIYYNGLFEVANSQRLFRTSMTVQVTIILQEAKQVLTIPITALGNQTANGSYTVKILQNGQVKKRLVRCGITDNLNIQITQGLHAGDQVILDSDEVGDEAATQNNRPRIGRRISS